MICLEDLGRFSQNFNKKQDSLKLHSRTFWMSYAYNSTLSGKREHVIDAMDVLKNTSTQFQGSIYFIDDGVRGLCFALMSYIKFSRSLISD